MKPSVFLVTTSFSFGVFGFIVALAASYFTDDLPRQGPMLLMVALTAVGVAAGFGIALFGLKLDASHRPSDVRLSTN
ncbi:MAG: hypothetical protein NXI04_09840 [Planctomycetaceae bacterium]|nr:hypothetical protein [Planctomycetaceae bacterium]